MSVSGIPIHAKDKKKEQVLPKVKFETSLGSIVIELYPKEAPVTVENFLRYVDEGFYVGTIFHRVVPNFMVQGGGLTFDFQRKGTHEPIVNEAKKDIKNELATIAMARTDEIDSATSQFFINLKDNNKLDYRKKDDPGYAVFGKVIEGFDTVKKIEREPRGLYRAQPDAPNYPVIIEKAYRLP